MTAHALPFLDGHARLGMGSWHLGQGRRDADSEIHALTTGAALGLTLIDTAEMYGDGASEELIGAALPAMPVRPFLVSKVLPHNASRRGVLRACEASRERLGVECIDLYLLHWRGGVPLAETVAAFEELRAQGQIRHWGVSNFDTDDMQELWRVPQGRHCVVNQVLYNVHSRGIEYDLLSWCREHGVGMMAYCPLGQGEVLEDGVLQEIGERHGVPAATVALAWALRDPGVIAIPESGSAEHVRANARALALQLDAQDLAAIDAASPPPRRKQPLDVL
ncbi:Aldo/keto reductase [Oryzisolibacter propanilivorax]|uniref:Aldo/keto reductase n=1 Tax=Oryzisolibacter propanilivorax TaxID=1527607 RepID=A0A1G9UYY0_9BURK|nr:aldo/keto reductase [Oryzisolibacter propanilivorax]SDM64855.1 Aldo/keto reductase [Oryzisolibacter propanilivorax]